MGKSRKQSRRDESVAQILTEYFGCDYFPTGKKELRIEIFEAHLLLMTQNPDSVQGIKKLLELFTTYDLGKSCASNVCLGCWWVILAKSEETAYTKEQKRIIELQREIIRDFVRLETHLHDLRELARGYPKPISFAYLVNVCTDLGARILAAKGEFTKVAQTDPNNLFAKMMKWEKPSGQSSAHTKKFRREITGLIDLLHDDIKASIKKTDSKIAQLKRTWKDEKEPFELEACRRAFEILRCFGIDMKSADNLRKSYERWKHKPNTNK